MCIYVFSLSAFRYVFSAFIHNRRNKNVGQKSFKKVFFQSISKYFNSFEHPHFQPQCVRISFLGFCALNKKQIWVTKFLRSIFRAILLKYLIILSNHNFSRTANGYVKQLNKKQQDESKKFKKFFFTQFYWLLVRRNVSNPLESCHCSKFFYAQDWFSIFLRNVDPVHKIYLWKLDTKVSTPHEP